MNSRYTSRRFVDEANLSWMPAFTMVDLAAGLEFENVTVTAFVRNLTNNDTIQSAQRQVDPGNPEGFAPGRAIVGYLPELRTPNPEPRTQNPRGARNVHDAVGEKGAAS
ncbi:MAG: hypothetical protein AAF830_17790 [Pseudomonadota bacterium]